MADAVFRCDGLQGCRQYRYYTIPLWEVREYREVPAGGRLSTPGRLLRPLQLQQAASHPKKYLCRYMVHASIVDRTRLVEIELSSSALLSHHR